MGRIRDEITRGIGGSGGSSAAASTFSSAADAGERCVAAALRRLEAEGCLLRGRCEFRPPPTAAAGLGPEDTRESTQSEILPVFNIFESKLRYLSIFC